ncbi:hypothetical protein [Clostridium cellulovorans]|nr:hypothetical protein [Clostridium cellulovorans]
MLNMTPTYAYNTFNNYKLNGGVGNYGYANRYYYIDSTAVGFAGLAS